MFYSSLGLYILKNVTSERKYYYRLVLAPSTDSGTLPNLRYSFSDAHVRKGTGGWTRQVTKRELGISTTIAVRKKILLLPLIR